MNAESGRRAQEKFCCVCSADVTGTRRVRDQAGKYYCPACYDSVRGASDEVFRACAACGQRVPERHLVASNGRALCLACRAKLPAAGGNNGTASSEAISLPPNLRANVTCPHCWHHFPSYQVLWVSQHAELRGDPVLGSEAMSRFLPTRFTVEGQAIDGRGMPCQALACPRCHLTVPRALLETDPLIVSIIGVPSSGKSYFLTAMTWELRRLLPSVFGLTFTDVDTVSNRGLNEYEETLFLAGNPEGFAYIRKTETEGELYDQIRLGQQVISLPRPFLFNLKPSQGHPSAAQGTRAGRIICLYDNAGEHFQPGWDSVSSPVTQHLARSRVLMFLYDPTQDPRFRERCRAVSNDPQLRENARAQRQETILTEAAERVRRYTGLPSSKKYDRPLIVIVPKLDAWEPLLGDPVPGEPFIANASGRQVGAVHLSVIDSVSNRVREMLLRLTPEFVAAAEDFCTHVVYVPLSALGRAPEVMPTGGLGIRPKDIRPRWATVPFLYMFAKWSTGLVAGASNAAAAPLSPASRTAV